MKENKKKANPFAKRGFFITLTVITAVMVIAVVMNLVVPSEEPQETFDADAWQEAVRQSAQDRDNALIPVDGGQASPASASAVPAPAPPSAAPVWKETEARETEPPKPSGHILLEPPAPGTIAKDYSQDELLYSETMEDWRVHLGVDFAAREGDPVCAAADGTVESVSQDGMLGVCVILSHAEGIKTLYANLQEGSAAPVGTQLKTGETVGKVGSSAPLELAEPPHLHFAVLRREEPVNPHDFLDGTAAQAE